ncbi:MAG: Arylsulfatase precursor, partial [Verrucomicrobiota bacterium]
MFALPHRGHSAPSTFTHSLFRFRTFAGIIALVCAFSAPNETRGQSPAVGKLLLKEDFRSGDDTTRTRFLRPSFNIADTWELQDGMVTSIYDPSKKKGHGHPIAPRCWGARDIRVSYRAKLEAGGSLSVVVDGDFPNKTGLPLWHLGDVNAALSSAPTKPNVSIWERRFTRDPETPGVRDKVFKPGGLSTNLEVIAPYYTPGARAARSYFELKPGEWHQFVFEIVGADWTYWVDGKEVAKLSQEYSDCPKEQVCFLGFGPLSLTDIVVEELPRPAPLDLIIVAGDSEALGASVNLPPDKPEPKDRTVPFWWRLGEKPPGTAESSSGNRWVELQLQPWDPKPSDKTADPTRIGSVPKHYGPEFGLVRELQAREPAQRFALLKVVFPKTGLRNGWDPAESNREGGACYRTLFSEIRSAIRAGREQGMAFRLRALVFLPGADAAADPAKGDLAEVLERFIKSIRGDLSAQKMQV